MPDFTADDLYGGYTPPPTPDYTPPPAEALPGGGGSALTATPSALEGVLSGLYAQDPHAAGNPLNAPGAAAAAANADGAAANGVAGLNADGTSNAPAGVLTKLLQGVGIANKAGNVDYSDPQVMQNILKSVGVLGNVVSTLQGPQNKKSAADLQAQFKSPFDTWNPTQQAAATAYFNNPHVGHGLTPANPNTSAVVPTRRYAEGGGIDTPDDANPTHVSPGALSLVQGEGGGQDDVVAARLAPGEYVWDAGTVSDLGDGNNAHGAEVLDKFREELRAHKRSAPADQIPPRAHSPRTYLAAATTKKGAK